MRELLKRIKELIEKKEISKDAYRPLIALLCDEVAKVKGTKLRSPNKNIFATGDERLQNERTNHDLYKDHPEYGLMPAAQVLRDRLYEWLKNYYIGFVSDFALSSPNMIDVTISCLLHPKICSDTPESDKKEFIKQMDRLEDIGIELCEGPGEHDFLILATEQNVTVLKALLKEFKAKGIQLRTWSTANGKHIIRELSCRIPVSGFPAKVRREKDIYKLSDQLNPDEFALLQKYMKDLLSARMVNTEDLEPVCSDLELYACTDLCDLFGIETELSKAVHEQHADERMKNQAAYELSKEIGQNMTPDMIQRGYKTLHERIDKIANERFGMDIFEFSVQEHAVFCKLGYPVMHEPDPAAVAQFDVYHDGYENAYYANEHNMQLLQDKAAECGARIQEMCVKPIARNGLCIGNIRITFDTLTNI